jgi:hypothetical protein
VATSSEGQREFGGEYRDVFDAVVRAVRVEGMTVTLADGAVGVVGVSSPMSAFSWGEDAEVRVWQAQPGVIGVGMQSKLKFGLVDWGRNKKNLDRLFARVQAELDAPTPAPATPPAWYADPRGRHESRYWDGTAWTVHVSDGGVVGEDPV